MNDEAKLDKNTATRSNSCDIFIQCKFQRNSCLAPAQSNSHANSELSSKHDKPLLKAWSMPNGCFMPWSTSLRALSLYYCFLK